MAGFKRVTFAFAALWEAAYAALFPQRIESAGAASKYLMHIRLMANIKYNPVHRRIKGLVQRHGKLHNAKV